MKTKSNNNNNKKIESDKLISKAREIQESIKAHQNSLMKETDSFMTLLNKQSSEIFPAKEIREIGEGIWTQTQHLKESLQSYYAHKLELQKKMEWDESKAIKLLNYGYELERQVHLKHQELNSQCPEALSVEKELYGKHSD